MVIAGKLCSGKSTLAATIAEQSLNGVYDFIGIIEISMIVRNLLNSDKRSDLQDSAHLEQAIKQTIHNRVADFYDQSISLNINILVLVIGPRQLSLIQDLPNCTYIWIEAPYEERYERFRQQSDKNGQTSIENFDKANERDNELGLTKVKQFIINKMQSQ